MAFSTDTDEAPRMTRAVQALIAITVALFGHLVADILYAVLDPRIRIA